MAIDQIAMFVPHDGTRRIASPTSPRSIASARARAARRARSSVVSRASAGDWGVGISAEVADMTRDPKGDGRAISTKTSNQCQVLHNIKSDPLTVCDPRHHLPGADYRARSTRHIV